MLDILKKNKNKNIKTCKDHAKFAFYISTSPSGEASGLMRASPRHPLQLPLQWCRTPTAVLAPEPQTIARSFCFFSQVLHGYLCFAPAAHTSWSICTADLPTKPHQLPQGGSWLPAYQYSTASLVYLRYFLSCAAVMPSSQRMMSSIKRTLFSTDDHMMMSSWREVVRISFGKTSCILRSTLICPFFPGVRVLFLFWVEG